VSTGSTLTPCRAAVLAAGPAAGTWLAGARLHTLLRRGSGFEARRCGSPLSDGL